MKEQQMNENMIRVLLPAEEIAARVAELADRIGRDYADAAEPPLFVGVLRGSFIFLSDLVRKIKRNVMLDFIAVSSYGMSHQTSGEVRLLKDLSDSIEGREVVLVEDIVDSGLTLSYLKQTLGARKPAGLRVACLLDKPVCRKVAFQADYVGFEIDDEFVVGYGLDYAEQYRNLPYIGVVKTNA